MYINPYEKVNKANNWYKANFHTHAGTGKGTCGAYELNKVISLYEEAGYHLLSISNHDYILKNDNYVNNHNISLIKGFEYSQDRHMLCIGINEVIEGEHQQVIDETNQRGGFVILCHPNWKNWKDKRYWSWEEIDEISGYKGIEIFNSAIFRLEGSGLATDTWDYLLSQGKLVWGFANDDFHRWYDLANAWNEFYLTDNNFSSLKNAINTGCFYATTGLTLYKFNFKNKKIVIKAGANNTYIEKYKYQFIGKNGKVYKEEEGQSGQYKIQGDEVYIRVKVISEHGAMLWTQPVYLESFFKRNQNLNN